MSYIDHLNQDFTGSSQSDQSVEQLEADTRRSNLIYEVARRNEEHAVYAQEVFGDDRTAPYRDPTQPEVNDTPWFDEDFQDE